MAKKNSGKDQIIELSIFEVGEVICALPIDEIQEINKHMEITRVDNAPDYIRGISNLRGSIITVIDMRRKFGMDSKSFDDTMRMVVVKNQGEQIGLLVDKMLDVLQAKAEDIEPTPSNINGIAGKYFSGIYKMENKLAALLNADEILSQK
jgi:purine-binding chemotaxis protein CheW